VRLQYRITTGAVCVGKVIVGIKTLIIVAVNLTGYLFLKRKVIDLKKERMFEDFYQGQITEHIKVPPNFENHYGKSRDYLMDVFKKMEPGSNVLELGCYLSKRLNWFAEKNPDLLFTGIDLSMKTLSLAKDNNELMPNVRLVAADFSNLPFKTGKFDAVFSHLALYHVPYSHIENVFKEIRRISKKDIIMIEPFHKVLPLKQKILLMSSPDKHTHDYRKIENDDVDRKEIRPLFDASSGYHPITVFHYLKK